MRIVIEGAGEVGSHLAKMLRAESNAVTVIDNDEERLKRLSTYADVETVEGNPSSISVLRSAGVEKADLFIAVYPFATQEVNIVGALLARHLGAAKVIARINDEDFLTSDNLKMFREMGIELMFYPEKSAADEIVSALRHSATSEVADFARGKLQISVFKLDEDSPMLDLSLGEFLASLKAENKSLFRIIAISRDNRTIIPNLDSRFLFGDLVFVITTKEGEGSLGSLFGKDNVMASSVMITGGTPIAEMVARTLARMNIKVKLIENDRSRCIELSERLPDSVLVVNGDPRNSDFLYEEGIRDFDAFVALTNGDEANVLSCVVAKKFGVDRTFAEVENIEYIHLAEEMGVDNVINKKLIMAGRIFKYTLSGQARSVRYMSGTEAEVIEYTVSPGSAITKKALRDIDFPENAIVGGVIRGSESFIAVGDTRIEPYDRVAIFAMPDAVKEVDRLFK